MLHICGMENGVFTWFAHESFIKPGGTLISSSVGDVASHTIYEGWAVRISD